MGKLRNILLSLFFLLFPVFLIAPLSALADPPAGFQDQTFILDLSEPTGITFTPDGRMLILERAGQIQVVQPGATQVDSTAFLQLTNINTDQGERGLVGLSLDPNFAGNGYYYIFYTANSPLRDRISRFTASGNSTVAGSEVVIWQDIVDAHFWHHGGSLAFGPDGKLYASTGDHFDITSGSNHVSQRLDSYHGKILRLNSDGSIPTDNPFYDGAGPNLDAIWARGLRNPFRFSFDPLTGSMYIGDNGSNSGTSIEELDRGIAGANYGWPLCEGSCGLAGMTNPIFSYSHNDRDASIIGGLVYRGSSFPAEYIGSYFYADYAQNWIRRLTFDGNDNVSANLNFEPEDGTLDGPYGDITDLKVGPDGALYYVNIGLDNSGNPTGPASIRKISYFATNQPPTITTATATPTSGLGPTLTTNFSGAATDPNYETLTYTRRLGDRETETHASPTQTYNNPGNYTARLAVSDGQAQTLSNPIYITVGTPPVVTVTTPITGQTFVGGEVVPFSGSATDADGSLTPANFSWTIAFRHEGHIHPAAGPIIGTSGVFTIPTTGHDFAGNTGYELILTVTDSQGLPSTASTFIYPDKVNLTFATNPTGLTLNFDQSSNLTAPLVRNTLIGFQHTIEAPAQQMVNNTTYNFVSWSDGGAANHVITAPAANQTYTALYQADTSTSGGVVTNCNDDSQLSSLLAGGGVITFNCGGVGATATITVASTKVISAGANVSLDGDEKITLSGGNARRIFQVDSGATLTLTDMTLSNGKDFGGGAIDNNGTLIIDHSTLSNNEASGNFGGAIKNGGTLTVTNSLMTTNTATTGYGGAIDSTETDSQVVIANSIFNYNSAKLGGGAIANNSIVLISQSTFFSNTTDSVSGGSCGGAIENTGPMTITQSTINNNVAGKGGGICNDGGLLTLVNSTLFGNSANSAPHTGGGIHNEGSGDSSRFGTVQIIASTLSGNTAIGGSGSNLYNTTGNTLRLRQTIVTGGNPANCAGIITSQGHNLDSGTSCGFSAGNNLINIDPQLGPLADNGGETLTQALLPESPAIDAVNSADCTNSEGGLLTTDQRGVARSQDGNEDDTGQCDIGAYEYQLSPPQLFSIYLPIVLKK